MQVKLKVNDVLNTGLAYVYNLTVDPEIPQGATTVDLVVAVTDPQLEVGKHYIMTLEEE